MIVPGFTYADPQYAGLRGEYYNGTSFERLRLTRIDGTVNFDWQTGSPAPEVDPTDPQLAPRVGSDYFSVRWTGQVQPRHSELYSFRTISDDGVRLWVDGRLIIDNWTDHPATENSGTIQLTAGRWYPITLEYYEKGGGATISLAWSSRSQIPEIVPQECLYAFVDDSAQLRTNGDGTAAETMLAGQAVVGESGPLPAADFGAPLFSPTAHLFTALVPGARLPSVRQRHLLRQVIEAEKPAHTDFHLCFIEARMRVGFQARVGLDSIVAGPPPAMSMSGTVLGQDSHLGDNDDDAGAVTGRLGKHARVGQDALVR
jgi:hypothetical protein